jgi:hypothetical protein
MSDSDVAAEHHGQGRSSGWSVESSIGVYASGVDVSIAALRPPIIASATATKTAANAISNIAPPFSLLII